MATPSAAASDALAVAGAAPTRPVGPLTPDEASKRGAKVPSTPLVSRRQLAWLPADGSAVDAALWLSRGPAVVTAAAHLPAPKQVDAGAGWPSAVVIADEPDGGADATLPVWFAWLSWYARQRAAGAAPFVALVAYPRALAALRALLAERAAAAAATGGATVTGSLDEVLPLAALRDRFPFVGPASASASADDAEPLAQVVLAVAHVLSCASVAAPAGPPLDALRAAAAAPVGAAWAAMCCDGEPAVRALPLAPHALLLATQWFTPPQPARGAELGTALVANCRGGFAGGPDAVLLVTEAAGDAATVPGEAALGGGDVLRLARQPLGRRLTFADALTTLLETDEGTGDDDALLLVANADVYVEDVAPLFSLDLRGVALALSRWEHDDGSGPAAAAAAAAPPADAFSQDAWLLRAGDARALLAAPGAAARLAVPLGVRGCDNVIAAELLAARLRLANPAASVVLRHVHGSGARGYAPHEYVVAPRFLGVQVAAVSPYALVDKPAALAALAVEPGSPLLRFEGPVLLSATAGVPLDGRRLWVPPAMAEGAALRLRPWSGACVGVQTRDTVVAVLGAPLGGAEPGDGGGAEAVDEQARDAAAALTVQAWLNDAVPRLAAVARLLPHRCLVAVPAPLLRAPNAVAALRKALPGRKLAAVPAGGSLFVPAGGALLGVQMT
jgi:hypothetical protein